MYQVTRIKPQSNRNLFAVAVSLLFISMSLYGCSAVPVSQIDLTPISVKMLNLEEHQKQINLVYYENKVPVPGKEITFCYYDEASSSRVVTNAKTDTSGILSIVIPGNEDEASSVFTFVLAGTSIPDAPWSLRIPPQELHGGQKSITVKFDGSMLVYNEGSPMELMALPKNGSKLDSVDSQNINILKFDETTGAGTQGVQLAMVNGGIKPIGVGDVLLEGSSFRLTK